MNQEQIAEILRLADAYAQAERSIEQEFERGTLDGSVKATQESVQARANLEEYLQRWL